VIQKMRQFSPLFSSNRIARIDPQHKNLAALFGAVRAVQLAGLDMKRRARPVLLALVDKVPFNYVETSATPSRDRAGMMEPGCISRWSITGPRA